MYERFTDRARKTMQLAYQEAQRSCHEFIGTEHILLGLIKEASGVGFRALQKMEVTEKVKITVGEMLTPGPDMIVMGKRPQTPRSKKVIEFAMEESRALHHNYLGTEHLLLGLIREQGGCAEQALTKHGVTLERAKTVICELLKIPREPMSEGLREELNALKLVFETPEASDVEIIKVAMNWITRVHEATQLPKKQPSDLQRALDELRSTLKSESMQDDVLVTTAARILRMHQAGMKAIGDELTGATPH